MVETRIHNRPLKVAVQGPVKSTLRSLGKPGKAHTHMNCPVNTVYSNDKPAYNEVDNMKLAIQVPNLMS
jgi:hypothetical protein